MSDETTEIQTAEVSDAPSLLPDFKKVCVKLGLMMIVIFVSRMVASVIGALISPSLEGMDITLVYTLETVLSFVFLYLIPIALAIVIMREPKKDKMKEIYSKPQYLGRALGMYPALYALAITVNLLTMLLGQFFAETDLNKSFNTVNDLQPANLPCALILFFQLVVIAPVFEEFWFRGIVMESLRPYGNGFAIFVSGLLFGMTHANFQQFFYATTLGICLGYIAISTRSIVTTTIMHAMFNSVSGVLLLLMSVESVGDYMLAAESGEEAEMTAAVVVFLVFMFMIILTMMVGLVMAVFKIKKIKKYKVPKVQTELSSGKRWGVFFTRVTVIIMLVLALDTFTFQFIPNFIYDIIA